MTGICNSFCMTRRIEMQLASLSEPHCLSLVCKALSISILIKQKRTARWNAWSYLVIWLRLPCNLRQVIVWSASSCSAWWMELETTAYGIKLPVNACRYLSLGVWKTKINHNNLFMTCISFLIKHTLAFRRGKRKLWIDFLWHHSIHFRGNTHRRLKNLHSELRDRTRCTWLSISISFYRNDTSTYLIKVNIWIFRKNNYNRETFIYVKEIYSLLKLLL